MTTMPIRDVSLHVKVIGHGYPLVLMHGGPGADLYTLMSFRPLANHFTLVFYDQRCNGRSTGAPVESMNFESLTADADALRHALGFEKWAVLGHPSAGTSPWNTPCVTRIDFLICCWSTPALISGGREKRPLRYWLNADSARSS